MYSAGYRQESLKRLENYLSEYGNNKKIIETIISICKEINHTFVFKKANEET
jgi:SOS response regulatory protein OraA/RecX